MNIVVTGSLGHIGRPLTKELLRSGHTVTVVSSTAERRTEIESLGARAAIGSMEDAGFLAATFVGADAVYVMEALAPASYADPSFDLMAAIRKIGQNYQHAIRQARVPRVVHLSSIGAHTNRGNGLLAFHYEVEQILGMLPREVAITFLRPVGFYDNLLGFIPTIKAQGVIASNYGGEEKKPWVSPLDIAAVAAEELTTPRSGREVRYVASEEISCDEIARVLGTAIGKPDLRWMVIPDERMLAALTASGMNPRIAAGLVEMNAATRTGMLYEDYYRNRPILGEVKIRDFAEEFTAAYNHR